MGGPVCTLHFGLFLILFYVFVTLTIYLERLRPIKLIKQNKTSFSLTSDISSFVFMHAHLLVQNKSLSARIL